MYVADGDKGQTPGGRQDRFPGFDVLAEVDRWDTVTAGVVLVPFALLFPSTERVEFSRQLIASFAYLVSVVSVGASLLWFWLLQQGEASRVSAFYFLTPAFGLALSALLLHETVGVNDLLGLAAVAAGIFLVQRA